MNLYDLLHDAVADVEPAERLDEIRSRTASPAKAARPWFWAAAGTVAATAAVVAGVAVLTDDDGSSGVAGHADPSMSSEPGADWSMGWKDGTTVPAYFVGGTPDGDRLFREFHQVGGDEPLATTVDTLTFPAVDPDYRTLWKPGSFLSAHAWSDRITVDLVDADRPAGMSAADAELAIQQVVYTAQGTVQKQLPVVFRLDGLPIHRVLGIDTTAPVEAAPPDDVLSPVSISDPAEGEEYAGSFTARGRTSSTAKTIEWVIVDGQSVRASGPATVERGEGGLSPWEAVVDLSDLAPGTYTFVASTGSDTGYSVTFTDTRTITVR